MSSESEPPFSVTGGVEGAFGFTSPIALFNAIRLRTRLKVWAAGKGASLTTGFVSGQVGLSILGL